MISKQIFITMILQTYVVRNLPFQICKKELSGSL